MVVDILNLILQVLWALIVTQWLCAQELFFTFIWSRRQKSVKDKVVVVTGAGHGLGRRIACEFAKLGAQVVCWDVDQERNQNTFWDIKQSRGKAYGVNCDVTDRVDVFRSVAEIRQKVGEIDILVNCVGVYPVQPTLVWTPEELYSLFDTNVMAQFWLLQAIVPHMIAQKSGHLAVISSAAAIAPVPGELPYSVTKSAVTGLMDGFLQELQLQGHDNLKVTCIHPYYTAVREDIPVKFELRIDRLSPDFVAGEIVRGIREEQEIISVPRFLLFWIHFMKLIPHKARRRWRNIFYTRVFPTNAVNYYTADGKKLNIVDLYKLAPLNESVDKARNLLGIQIIPSVNDALNNNNNSYNGPIVQPAAAADSPEINTEEDRNQGHDNPSFTVERF